MKKIIVIMLCALLTIMSVSCNGEKTEAKEVEHFLVFFASGDASAAIFDESEHSQEEINAVKEKFKSSVFYSGSKMSATRSQSTKDMQEISINDVGYKLDYYKSYKEKVLANEKYDELALYDEYQDEKGDIRLQVRSLRDQIVYFKDRSKDGVLGSVTEDKAIEIANGVLKSVYGDSITSEYDFDRIVDGENSLYHVQYIKYVWGVPTNDVITISVNKAGDISGISARMLGAYVDAEKNITKAEVDTAVNYLKEQMQDNYDIYTMNIIINSNCEYFIEAYVAEKEPNSMLKTVYINIQ